MKVIIRQIGIILLLAVMLILAGCSAGDTGMTDSTEKEETDREDKTMIKSIVINTTVRKTGQYPENIVLTLTENLAGEKLSADDFVMKGRAEAWMDPNLHDFEALFGKVETDCNTIILYPKDFPKKFFCVREFTVECSSNPALSFTYNDVDKVITPVADDFETIGMGTWDYHIFTPQKTEKMPVVIVFHGFGDTYNLLTYRTAVEWAEPENQALRPCYVIAPVIKDEIYYTEQGRDVIFKELKGLLDDMAAKGQADPDRIYVMGNSFGGMSSIEFSEKYPDSVAGILALCPALNYSKSAVDNIDKIKDIPVRFAHAVNDGTIPVSETRTAYDKLQKAGAKEVLVKEYSDDEMNEAGAEPSNESTYSYHHVELAVMEDDEYMEWLYSRA